MAPALLETAKTFVLAHKLAFPLLLLLRSLDKLPFYGAGISSGASFLLKLPRYIKASACRSGWGCCCDGCWLLRLLL